MLYTQAGGSVGPIGQGTWHLGDNPLTKQQEIKALSLGIDEGMNLIDSAEMYGEGRAEMLVGEAIKGFAREDLYLVSKVYPWNAGEKNIFASCNKSLARINTPYLDLYLLHWPGQIPLEETVFCMEKLKTQGKILNWGVSNFDTRDMKTLLAVPGGENCKVNQVLYHLGSRGIEHDLLPLLKNHSILTMAYCPLAQGGKLRQGLLNHPVLKAVAQSQGSSPHQVLLAFLLSEPGVLPIPRSGNPNHTLQNAKAASITLTPENLGRLNEAFPPPKHKVPLDVE